MPRKNPFVRVGRPPAPTSAFGSARPARGASGALPGPSPTETFGAAVPAAAFSRGGRAHGHKPMPAHHDDPKFFCKGGRS